MTPAKQPPTPEELERITQSETGGRQPMGIQGKIIWTVALTWSLFQLWYASPLPFALGFGVFNTTEARSIHLSFAVFLALTAYPALKSSPRDSIPILDWILAIAATMSASYLYFFYDSLATRAGAPITQDLVVAVIGIILLLEATRRSLGLPLMIVAIVFLGYTFFGPYMPELISHRGASLGRTMSHQWLTTEGVFGVAIGVSSSFVFLFVLFGSLLERAGAGAYFIKVAFSLLGHMRGGPAKAAVVASGFSGIISGSSIANVVTTGTFTIPLMKRVGFPGTKAGAIEVAASTNGQLTPPIMGAAAFLMVEYVGISYLEVIKHALLPAIISYIALIYIVHLEAVKANMKGLPRTAQSSMARSALSFVGTFLGMCLLSLLVYYGVGWTRDVFGPVASVVLAVAMGVAYVALLRVASRYPDSGEELSVESLKEVPALKPILLSGLHFLLPVFVLVWCLMVERFSPGLSAFWATTFMVFILITQRPVLAFFRRSGDIVPAVYRGIDDLFSGLVTGARNMIGIGVATATAGIVVGTVTLTGIGLVMTDLVEFISGGNLMLMLIFTAIISLILGMGLPTTANYIVVSTLMAPVIVALGAQHGLIVPLIAVHLFVFYFGILADDTPPVGLAAYAAAAISRSDPIATGIQGFTYDMRTAILPFMFIFNTQLLLIDIPNIWELIFTVAGAIGAMLTFASATQGYWMVKNRLWESLVMLVVAFSLFRPGFWMDMVYHPMTKLDPVHIADVAEKVPSHDTLRMRVAGETFDGREFDRIILLPLGKKGADGMTRIEETGLILHTTDDQRVIVDMVVFGSKAQQMGFDFDWEILYVEREEDQPTKHLMFIPAIATMVAIGMLQRRRQKLQAT
ncbi:TRAP transporter permease [Desulfurispirillum indicum]|uniref:TRAP transporter permease n=1 Tax=Desulfurispirillum indicum TaxID=936456 RepID=UPI001CFAB057|nr:TRAP transporter permease [Desulfurispirillum indicum]UCZ57846.1 TRAP transporter permease [Desulfurispirillum indicum]